MAKRFLEVNQFHSSLALGDAVTSDMLEIQRVLQDAGYRSRLFGEHIQAELKDRAKPVGQYFGDVSSLLIVHHSMGFNGLEDVLGLPDRKILKYHNITPPEFLPNEYLKQYSKKGREQLSEYREYVEAAFGDSNYNRAELEELGYRYTGVLPIFFSPTALLDQSPSESVADKLRGHFNLLFVGRIAPNKCQIDLVRIFDQYHSAFNSNARLHLVGSAEGFAEYHRPLMEEIKKRKLGDVVSVPGKVSASELAAYYRGAQVLVCASEHEGFCVPLLEAMAFDLPVVAYAQAAVAETIGQAGVLLDSKEPQLWLRVWRRSDLNGSIAWEAALCAARAPEGTEWCAQRRQDCWT